MIHLSQLAPVVNGQLINQQDAVFQGVSINTRAECGERLFVALKGENFDAHDFIEQAQKAGSSAVMVERPVESEMPALLVQDTHKALTEMAAWWRAQFVIPLVGVTGSVGKTSVKEMLGSIFAQIGDGVVTQGNLNNEIGVPLTLMRLDSQAQYAVVEMGMNHAGEISRITNMARPTIALINNAAAAHLEGLGTIEAVADAKGEIFEGLADDGIAIINDDDSFAEKWKALAVKHKILTFSLCASKRACEEAQSDVVASYRLKKDRLVLRVNAMGETFKVRLSTVGEHNARNALAAITTAVAANISIDKIQAGLEAYRPISGRLNLNQIGETLLIDDTYNANPLSMLAAIKVLTQYDDQTLIVGDMAELGSAVESEHRALGKAAAEHGVNRLLACGEYAKLVVDAFNESASSDAPSGYAFAKQAELIEFAVTHICGGAVLVKGSRSAKMEIVIDSLKKTLLTPNISNGRKREC